LQKALEEHIERQKELLIARNTALGELLAFAHFVNDPHKG
jgi:hypothetical protein